MSDVDKFRSLLNELYDLQDAKFRAESQFEAFRDAHTEFFQQMFERGHGNIMQQVIFDRGHLK